MPWASAETTGEYYQTQAQGPIMLTTPAYATGNLPPVTLAVSASWNSGILASDGYKSLAAGVTSSLTGTLTIQRYLDPGGTVAIGSLASVSLVAATAASLAVNDGTPFSSFRIVLTNTGAGTTTITNFFVLLAAT